MPSDALVPDAWPRPRPFISIAIITLYAVGLLRDLNQPWVGMQDWNGAFYSYTTRNLMRYPLAVSGGLPVVEIGPIPPPPAETQRYATHPPGLPWLLAVSFSCLGVSEASARLVPILCSLAALWLMMRVVASTMGRTTALLAGLLYAVIPMSVYFGRMVNHEAVVLCCMMLATWGWYARLGKVATNAPRFLCFACWLGGLVGAIWVDWPGGLLAAALFVDAIIRRARGECGRRDVVVAALAPAVVTVMAACWLVYGGMGGSWQALYDMAFSRSAAAELRAAGDGVIRRDISMRGGAGQLTVDNFGWPVLVLAGIGMGAEFVKRLRRSGPADAGGAVAGMDLMPRRASHGPLLIWTMVGATWLALFAPQFLRHNYWQFYLGPTVAVLAACGLRGLHTWLRDLFGAASQSAAGSGRALRRADVFVVGIVAVTLVAAVRGADDYFQRRSFQTERVAALRTVTAMLGADETALLFENIVDPDIRGSYRYRNLAPPHVPYYLDRRAIVVRTTEEVKDRAGEAAVLLVLGDLAGPGSAGRALLEGLPRRWPRFVNHPYIIVDLKPDLERIYGNRID